MDYRCRKLELLKVIVCEHLTLLSGLLLLLISDSNNIGQRF